jgi:hypothetical protein
MKATKASKYCEETCDLLLVKITQAQGIKTIRLGKFSDVFRLKKKHRLSSQCSLITSKEYRFLPALFALYIA